jgi:hypothetical protein
MATQGFDAIDIEDDSVEALGFVGIFECLSK